MVSLYRWTVIRRQIYSISALATAVKQITKSEDMVSHIEGCVFVSVYFDDGLRTESSENKHSV